MKDRKNLFFGIWLATVFIAVVSIIIAFSSRVESPNSGVPSTSVPVETATASPPPQVLEGVPRSPQTSLNQSINFTQVLGGSGSDILSGVITLDCYYLFGTTTTTSGDFASCGDLDIFLAKIGINGELLQTKTVQSKGKDIVISAKPYSKLSEGGKSGIAIVSKTEGKDEEISITKISADMASSYQTTISFDGKAEVVATNQTANYLSLQVNVETSSKSRTEILHISHDLQTVERNQVLLDQSYKTVEGLAMGSREIMLVNIFDEESGSIGMLTFDMETKEKMLTKFEGNFQKAISMRPKTSGGFLVEYSYVENAVNKFGILSISKDFNIEFTHVLSGGDYRQVSVVEDYKQKNSMGYYIFATKQKDNSYETFSEYICPHGDLIYIDTTFLSNILPKKFHISEEGLAVVGEIKKDGQTDISLSGISSQGDIVQMATFGGSGEEAYVFSIARKGSGLAIFATTLSSNGDIPRNQGKTEIWMMETSE